MLLAETICEAVSTIYLSLSLIQKRPIVTQQETYEELKELARSVGLSVRVETGDFDGGLCTVRDTQVILINRRHPLARRINLLARSLNAFGIDDRFVKPALRSVIDDEVHDSSST